MISLKDVKDAKERMTDIAYLTPILQSEQLSKICGNRMFLKSEHLQKTGSFKIRGASNKVINAVQNGVKYVTAASSGNHGQAVDRKSTRLNSSHVAISYAVFCLKKKKNKKN